MVDSSETGIAPEKRARWCGVGMWLEVAQPFYLDLDIILAFSYDNGLIRFSLICFSFSCVRSVSMFRRPHFYALVASFLFCFGSLRLSDS